MLFMGMMAFQGHRRHTHRGWCWQELDVPTFAQTYTQHRFHLSAHGAHWRVAGHKASKPLSNQQQQQQRRVHHAILGTYPRPTSVP
eukprot:5029699-Amphidinium_carterae.1